MRRGWSVILALLTPTSLLAQAPAVRQLPPVAKGVTLTPLAARPAAAGSEAVFTGTVHVQPVFGGKQEGNVSAGSVTFEPGARSAWHTHPRGQHLIVLSGLGWTQVEGGPIVEMHPGDVIWCPPGVRHWHGASPTTSVTHMAVQEAVDGKNVDWQEKVSDEQYSASHLAR